MPRCFMAAKLKYPYQSWRQTVNKLDQSDSNSVDSGCEEERSPKSASVPASLSPSPEQQQSPENNDNKRCLRQSSESQDSVLQESDVVCKQEVKEEPLDQDEEYLDTLHHDPIGDGDTGYVIHEEGVDGGGEEESEDEDEGEEEVEQGEGPIFRPYCLKDPIEYNYTRHSFTVPTDTPTSSNITQLLKHRNIEDITTAQAILDLASPTRTGQQQQQHQQQQQLVVPVHTYQIVTHHHHQPVQPVSIPVHQQPSLQLQKLDTSAVQNVTLPVSGVQQSPLPVTAVQHKSLPASFVQHATIPVHQLDPAVQSGPISVSAVQQGGIPVTAVPVSAVQHQHQATPLPVQTFQIVGQVVTTSNPTEPPAFHHQTKPSMSSGTSTLIIPPVHKPKQESSADLSQQTSNSSGQPQQVFHMNNGKTKAYTYEAFFASDGRSKKIPASEATTEVTTKPKYTCSECGKHYATSSNLSRHRQTHRTLDSANAKKCPICNKMYVSMPALSMHVLTHNLNHKCNICGKAFSRPWLLQGHLRSHTGDKPYGCAHCGKSFADRSNLRAHMQTHSSFKAFKCKRCGKSFALKSYLNKHLESACYKEQSAAVGGAQMMTAEKGMIPVDMETPPATPPSSDYSSDQPMSPGGDESDDGEGECGGPPLTIDDGSSSPPSSASPGEVSESRKHVIHVPQPVFTYRHQLISV